MKKHMTCIYGHYCEKTSRGYDGWTACGLRLHKKTIPVTNRWKHVECKNCLKINNLKKIHKERIR